MKTKTYKLLLMTLMVIGLITYSCADLNVINTVEPDSGQVQSKAEDLMGLAGGAFRVAVNAAQEYDGPALSMQNMADQMTCSWGNSAMRDLGKEPRLGFNNTVTYAYFPIVSVPWGAWYSAVSSVNDVLKAVYGGKINFGKDVKMVKAWCYFVSGASHSYVGLTYDKGSLINWDTDLASLTFLPWQDVINGSLVLLDSAIAICDAEAAKPGGGFTLPLSWVGGQTMTAAGLSKLANSYAARTMVYSSRNKTHNEALSWTKILSYANKGITTNFSPIVGSNYDWYDIYWAQGCYSGWARIDCRIINIFNHSYPSRWGDGNTAGYGQPTSSDARLLSDFQYLPAQSFPPDRGYYFFSSYRYKRYDYINVSNFGGDNLPKPVMLAWENEMIKAEALVRTGSIPAAVAVLNSPTGARKVRGGLTDVTATVAADVLRFIWDEKDVELIFSGMGISFFDMRRTDRLLTGTILHFPIPATELEIANYPRYTIDGTPDGINISNGGWTGYTK
jgi:hypothetical protein